MRHTFTLALPLVLIAHLVAYSVCQVHAADHQRTAHRYDLSRGAGETHSECVMIIEIGPGITIMDLEATRTDSYSARLSLRGTSDSVICDDILHPATENVLTRSVLRFHNGTTVPLAEVLHQILEAGKQPRMPQTVTSTALEKIQVHSLHAVAVYQGMAVRPDANPIDTPQGIIHVTVEPMRGPITLLLMSYDPVDWNVSAAPGAHIGSVILRGYYRQTIRGLDQTVPVNFASAEDDNWYQIFPQTLVRSRDGLIDFKAYVRSMVGVEPATVQSLYTGDSLVIDGKTTLAFPNPIERPITQPVVFESKDESSARSYGRPMISSDRLTVGYGMSGASTESIATMPHSRGKWYAEFIVHAGSDNGIPNRWTNVGIRSTNNEYSGLTSQDGQLAYEVKRYLKTLGGLRDKDVIGLAIDVTEGHLYIRHNGVWLGGLPDSGAPIVRITKDREYVVAVEVGSPGRDYSKMDTWTGNFGSTPFRHPIPQGFEPYGGRRPNP